MKKAFWIFCTLIIVTSCTNKTHEQNRSNPTEYMIQSVLWYRHSGEMQALCYQAFNTAKLMLDQNLKNSTVGKKKAVVADIDETVLNNAGYEAWLINMGKSNNAELWKKWVDSAIADTIPGALGFFKYAQSMNVEVFYLSNRIASDIPSTIKNLNKFGFPYADEKHMVFKTDDISSKEKRRKAIAEQYEIVLLCGDNLGDFSSAFDNRQEPGIFDSIAANSNLFGKKFIVFPNPMYGSWEKQLFGNRNLTTEQKDSIRLIYLKR